MVQQNQTCYDSSPHTLSKVRDHACSSLSLMRLRLLLLLLLLHFISCKGRLSLGSLLPTSAVPCLLCASLLLGTRLLLATSLFFLLPLLDDFLNTQLVVIPNYFPRTLRQPLFNRASSLSRGCVEGHGIERHPRLHRRSIRPVEALALFYTTVPRALKRGTTRLVRHSAADPQCPFAREEENPFAILQN